MSKAARAYSKSDIQTSVSAADSTQLIILIYERLFDRLKMGKCEFESGGYAIEVLSSAHDILQKGLLACLDYEEGGQIALSLGAIYEWALRELIAARLERSSAKLDEIMNVLTPLYDAWIELSAKNVAIKGSPEALNDSQGLQLIQT